MSQRTSFFLMSMLQIVITAITGGAVAYFMENELKTKAVWAICLLVGFCSAYMVTVFPLKVWNWWYYGRDAGQPFIKLSASKWTDEEKRRRAWRKELLDD